jgi:hypothetical protein
MAAALKMILPLVAACLLLRAQDPSWKTKSVDQWDLEDAKQVLTESPWSGRVRPQWTRDLSPDERRAGGDMEADMGKGVGLEGLIGIFSPAKEAAAIQRAHAKPDPGAFLVRWESARPVQLAEQKLPDPEAAPVATLVSDRFYAIAAYDIPTPKRWNIQRELRGIAALKRFNRKDLKPARVAILRKDGTTATVVYLFPRSVEITSKDGKVVFQAQIGRLVLTRVFFTYEMQIHNQLEL